MGDSHCYLCRDVRGSHICKEHQRIKRQMIRMVLEGDEARAKRLLHQLLEPAKEAP